MATAGGTTVPDSWLVNDPQGTYVRQAAPLPTQDMSAMWGGTGSTPASAPATGGAPADYGAQAKSLYTDILGREGDAEGTQFWTDQLASGKSLADVTASFKDSARSTLNNYLTGGESPYADLLNQDLKDGTAAGGFTGGQYQNALEGLDSNVFTNLYGPRPTPAPVRVVGTNGTATAAQAPQFTDIAPERQAEAWTVNPNQTSAYQLEQMLKSDSPLMQLARTRALQDMARSGTTNSSMAATAGEVGMIDRAQPFALNDAGTYADAARFTADARNQFARDANQFGREQTMANFNVTANDWASDRALGRQLTANDRDFAQRKELTQLGYGHDKEMAGINFENTKALNETGSNSQDAILRRGYINSINQARSDYATALANISSSTTMESGLKTETLNNLKVTYNTMIENYAALLGWDPASWLITTESTTAPATATAPAVNGVEDPTFSPQIPK